MRTNSTMNEPNNRERRLLNMWAGGVGKAIVINGHGVLSNSEKLKKVPKGVALMFLAQPGTCMNINTGLGVHSKFFTSINKFTNFLKSGRSGGHQYHHVTNILARTHFENNQYPNMQIQIEPNKEHATMGYIKTVPSRGASAVPKFSETVGHLKPNMYKLSNIISRRKGIVVVSACRQNPNVPNSRTVYNIPPKSYRTMGRHPMLRGTSFGSVILDTKYYKSKKGLNSLGAMQAVARGLTKKKQSSRESQFKQLSRIVYSGAVHKPKLFRRAISSFPANMSVVQQKLFNRLRKHYKKPPTAGARKHRSGLWTSKNVSQ